MTIAETVKRTCWVAALASLPWMPTPSLAQAPALDPQDVAEGMRIYRQKADCQTCHGWAADGRKMDTQMPDGANLRTSRLGRAGIVMAIKCGRPGRSMPAFDRFAYSDGRCFGMKASDLKDKGLDLPDPPATLQPREIEMVTDFLFAKVIGKGPMDRAACIEFWSADVDTCKEFSK
ncbi:MAG: cytochrome c [Acidobacteria bacterium]|nr:cytochrome c [Acidobacteriota bacterium]